MLTVTPSGRHERDGLGRTRGLRVPPGSRQPRSNVLLREIYNVSVLLTDSQPSYTVQFDFIGSLPQSNEML